MGLFSGVKRGIGWSIRPKKWLGTEQMKKNTRMLGELFQILLMGQKAKHASTANESSTFEACMQKYGLSEEDLKNRMRQSRLVALFCFSISMVVFAYTLYLFMISNYFSALITAILASIAGIYAFQEHFNYFRMKTRQLNPSYWAWANSLINRDTK